MNIAPNLTAVLAYYAGIKKGEINGMFYGSLIGVVEDSLSGAFLGPHMLSKGLVGYLSSFIYHKFFIWTPVLGIIGLTAFTITDGFIVFTSRTVFDRMPSGLGTASFIIIMQSFINGIIGIFIKPDDKKDTH